MAFHSYTHLIQKLFNAYRCGPPSRVTGTSTWTCVDHSVSRLPQPTQTASSASLSLRLGVSSLLTSLVMVTRRFIMQKARRHQINRLRPLVGAWFQVLFHSPHRGAFHRSLTVLSTIGLTGVFSLTGWSRQIRAGFHVSRVTQDTTKLLLASNTELSSSVVELSRTFFSQSVYYSVVLLPQGCIATTLVWALPRSLATTWGIIHLFSLPRGTKMFQFPRFASLI